MLGHSAKSSQYVAVGVTLILEILFAFLGGWTLYDTFTPWGTAPAAVIGCLVGATLLLLYLYVFIFREYAIDAVKIFAARRGEQPGGRLAWSRFLAIACILMDSFFNADRIASLPDVKGKFFIWAGLQLLVFVPFALGKLVHAHVNVDTGAKRAALIAKVDTALYSKVQEILPSLGAGELLALRQGDTSVLNARLNAIETPKEETDPLAQRLAGFMTGNAPRQETEPLQTTRAKAGATLRN